MALSGHLHKNREALRRHGLVRGANLYELLDKDLYSFGRILGGHTLKHIGAAVSCYMILSWIRQRRSVPNPIVQSTQSS